MRTTKADPAAMATLHEKLKSQEAELALISEKLGSAEYERNEATKTAKETEAKIQSLNEVSPVGTCDQERLKECNLTTLVG